MLIDRASLRLIRTQNSDGGWEWDNPDTNPSTGVPSPANTIGVTALGVLEAYGKLPNGDLILVYQNLMQVCTPAYGLMVTYSGNPAPSKHRIRGPDITFLTRLTQFLKDNHYADFAKTRWESAKTEFGAGTATGFAQFIRHTRKSQGLPAIISWDINLYIQGLLALHRLEPGGGFDVQAKEMAEVIYTSLYVPPPGPTIDGAISVSEWGAPVWTITGTRANYNVYLVTDPEAIYVAFEYLGADPTMTSSNRLRQPLHRWKQQRRHRWF